MFDVVVFDHLRALDLIDVRSNLIRIPEVLKRLREAEGIFESLGAPQIDLVNFVSSEDAHFLRGLKQKTLASALVHLGLFERWRRRSQGDFLLLGPTNSQSPMPLITGTMSLVNWLESYLGKSLQRLSLVENRGLPQLSGVELPQYGLFLHQQGVWTTVARDQSSPFELLELAKKQFGIDQMISLGVNHAFEGLSDQANLKGRLSILEDPMLQWIWSDLRGTALAN